MALARLTPPEVTSTAVAARPPDLPPRLLMAVDFAITCSLVQPGRPRYPVLVHQAAALLRASFRPRLAAAPLRFANPSPPSGWIEAFHLQALDHARHTSKTPGGWPPGVGRLPGSLRRSWIEVALPAEHRGPDVLVVDESNHRPRAVGAVTR